MKVLGLILLIIIPGILIIWLGHEFYESKHRSSFNDNVVAMMHLFKMELHSIENELSDDELSQQDKEILIERRNKIVNDLNTFFGETVYN